MFYFNPRGLRRPRLNTSGRCFAIKQFQSFADLDGVDTQDNRLEYISIHEVFADLDALDRQLADCFLISIHEVFADLDLTSGVCCITSF